MWFAFGFITLISFTVYLGLKRHDAKWKGTHAVHKSIAYEYMFDIEKYEYFYFFKREHVLRFRVAVKAPADYDFSLKRETRLDRMCKQLGLSVEHQVGDADYDHLVYVVSNDGHLAQHMTDRHIATDLLIRLFRLSRYESTLTTIQCRGGRLWAEFAVGKQFRGVSNLKRLNEVVTHAAGLLQGVAVQLEQHRPNSTANVRDPFIWRAGLLLACSSGLFINGSVHFLRLFLDTGGITLDTSRLWQLSLYGAVSVVTVLGLMALVVLGRSARTHLVLIELLLVGGIGATLSVFTELRDLNMEADASPIEHFKSNVVDKASSQPRKGFSRYTIDVRDWTRAAETHTIPVSRSFYSQVTIGTEVEIHQRAGYFGWPWVEYYGIARSGSTGP